SQTSVAAVHEISECAQAIANSRANGVFVVLDRVSPNRDSLAVKLTYRTAGDPSNWALTEFHVQPTDPHFKCDGFELASEKNKIKLQALTKEIGCSKSPAAHLTLVIATTQGGGVSIPLDSVDEQLQKLRDDMDAKIAGLSMRLDKAIGDTTGAISANKATTDQRLDLLDRKVAAINQALSFGYGAVTRKYGIVFNGRDDGIGESPKCPPGSVMT